MKVLTTQDATARVAHALDELIAAEPGAKLGKPQANEALLYGMLPLYWAHHPDLAGASKHMIRELGLAKLVERRGDINQLQRRLSHSYPTLAATIPVFQISEVIEKFKLSLSSQGLIDRSRGSTPPGLVTISNRVTAAKAKLAGVMEQLKIEGELPKFDTAKIPEAETRPELAEPRALAWELYQQAKASLKGGNLVLAEAQLELASAYNLQFLSLAKNGSDDASRLETMRAQNRIGMIVHQFGLLAKARGDEFGHESCEVKALRWYADVTKGENLGNYQPAAFLNSACSYAQLGDLDRGLTALQQMLDACDSSEKRESMKKNAREDPELAGLYAGNGSFQKLVG